MNHLFFISLVGLILLKLGNLGNENYIMYWYL
jgi:hypothetical protein